MKKTFELDFSGRKIIVESGQLAKQAHGSVVIRYGDTVVLSNAVVSKNVNLLSDFFPLMVLYNEKLYSVGKIPGGFIKREGRPTENATLAARMIDRPLRPLFPEDFKHEVQIINTILSVEQDNTPELTALFGSSLATSISKIPFNGPVAGVKVGRINNEFIINPTVEQIELSDIDLTVSGTKEAINMVEASAKEVNEKDMLEALLFGHKAIKELITFQEEIIKEIGQEKMTYQSLEISDLLKEQVKQLVSDKMDNALRIKEKQEKYEAIENIKKEVMIHFEDKNQTEQEKKEQNAKLNLILSDIEYREFRKIVVNEKIRTDGRKMDEIREIQAEIDFLPRTHGSAIFTRGETQSLSVTTLGALGEHQILDGLGIEDSKRFILHYNFPQFSVGETGRYMSPGRREIGHGALGEKALLQVIPSEEEFPYTIRVVSEILESNGSSSQASICAGCMSLMAAGVPIKAPIAGIAMGLITNDKDYTILTDIAGLEDHLGDMDFKVAGTKNGICALQMDIKIQGITKKILEESLKQAKKARLEILKKITAQIKEPRKEVSKYAPKTYIFTVDPNKIKDIIGRGGEMITKIILESSNVAAVNDINAVKVDLEDDGRVIIYHTDQEIIDKCTEMIKNVVKEVELNKIYEGKVVKIEEFGCFVELWPGCDGLVHISHLSKQRVEKTSDVVKVGDVVKVKSIGLDKRGKINLSMREII